MIHHAPLALTLSSFTHACKLPRLAATTGTLTHAPPMITGETAGGLTLSPHAPTPHKHNTHTNERLRHPKHALVRPFSAASGTHTHSLTHSYTHSHTQTIHRDHPLCDTELSTGRHSSFIYWQGKQRRRGGGHDKPSSRPLHTYSPPLLRTTSPCHVPTSSSLLGLHSRHIARATLRTRRAAHLLVA